MLLTAAAVLLVLAVSRLETGAAGQDLTLSFTVRSEQYTEILHPWQAEDGYYLFLPGCVELDEVFISQPASGLCIANTELRDGLSCGLFMLDHPYPVYDSSGKEDASSITFVRSGSLPVLHIDTASGTMDYIHLDKNNKESGSIRLYSENGTMLHAGLLSTVKGRGNTSWDAWKKPYNLSLAEAADLLGMGTAQNWVLLAEGFNAANVRNKIVYDFASSAGLPYSPGCEWVELYLNGSYQGLYLLAERNEIHPERIDIPEEGSFLVSMEYESRLHEQKLAYAVTRAGQAFRVRSGEPALVQQKLQAVENAVMAEDGVDPVSGKHWTDLIDLDSWARKYLVEEIFGNLDAGSLSQFFYCDGSDLQGRVSAGPVWDYDFAMGGESVWLRSYSDYYTMNRAYVNDEVYTPWFAQLCRQELFLDAVKRLYAQEFLPLLEELSQQKLKVYFQQTSRSAEMDCLRWGLDRDAAQQDMAYIQWFLDARTAFLTDLWVNETRYYTVCVDPGRYGLYGYFAVKEGAALPQLPSADSLGGLAWYDLETGEVVDLRQPVDRDMKIGLLKEEVPLPVIHYIPVAVVALMLPVLAALDSRRRKKKGRMRNDSAKVS